MPNGNAVLLTKPRGRAMLAPTMLFDRQRAKLEFEYMWGDGNVSKVRYDKEDNSCADALVGGGLSGAAAQELVRYLRRGGVQERAGTVQEVRCVCRTHRIDINPWRDFRYMASPFDIPLCGSICAEAREGERWERRRGRMQRPERVAAVSRCQGAPSTQADAGYRNRLYIISSCVSNISNFPARENISILRQQKYRQR